MAIQPGTNFFAPVVSGAKVLVALTDESGNAILVKCATGDIPTGVAGYAVGCLLINITTGVLYYNNSVTSCSFATV